MCVYVNVLTNIVIVLIAGGAMEQCPRDVVDSAGCGGPAAAVGGRGQFHTEGLRNTVRAAGGRHRHLVAAERPGDCAQDGDQWWLVELIDNLFNLIY